MARTKDQEADSAAGWVETELRDTKARLAKVEGELDQALKRVFALGADVSKLVEALNVSSSSASLLAGLREDLRQVHDQIGKLQERQAALTNKTEEIARQRGSEASRDRHDILVVAKQLEATARGVEQFESRVLAVEEALRRTDESVAGARLDTQGVERAVEEVTGRTTRSMEAIARVEQDVARAATEAEVRRRDIGGLEDKARLMLDQVHRLSERVDKMDHLIGFPEEARDLIQRAGHERDQLTQRMALQEKLSGEITEELQKLAQFLSRLDQRGQNQAAQILDLTGRLNELSDMLNAHMARMLQLLLRQRRRQAEALAQEIKELTQSGFHGGD